jgi:hypothetical protein
MTHKETIMKRNEGTIDRAVRVGAGLGLIGLHVSGVLGAWAWIGLVPLLTGLAGTCPLYSIFGISTCRIAS